MDDKQKMDDRQKIEDRPILNDRHAMLRCVQMYEFTLIEANLFLDTHPTDQKALEYFKMQRKLYDEAVMAYTMKYGPLTADKGIQDNRWAWVDGPWPWEYHNEVMK